MEDKSGSIPVTGIVPLTQMVGGDDEDTRLLRVMADGAEKYLLCFPWCRAIRAAYFGDGYGGVVAVFLFWIEPSHEGVDEWLWVVFGDVPPAFLVIDVCKTPSQALQCYIREVSKWVELAKQGHSSNNHIPVYVPATRENALEVESRLKLLEEIVVPAFREAEIVRA